MMYYKERNMEKFETLELPIHSNLGDIPKIDFKKFWAEMCEEDKISEQEISAQFNTGERGILYIIDGATPHLLSAAVEADKQGFIVRGIGMGKHLGNPSEQRTAGVALSLGIKDAKELKKLFHKTAEEKRDTVLFLLEPTTHDCQKSLKDVYKEILGKIKGEIKKIVLVLEDLSPKNDLEKIACRGGGEFDNPNDLLANWCHKHKVQLKATGFYKGHKEMWSRHPDILSNREIW